MWAVCTCGLRVTRDDAYREEAAAKAQELDELAAAKAAVDNDLAEVRSQREGLEERAAQLSSELQSLRSQLDATSADADAAKVCAGSLLYLSVGAFSS